jgi:hypothetical protein
VGESGKEWQVVAEQERGGGKNKAARAGIENRQNEIATKVFGFQARAEASE